MWMRGEGGIAHHATPYPTPHHTTPDHTPHLHTTAHTPHQTAHPLPSPIPLILLCVSLPCFSLPLFPATASSEPCYEVRSHMPRASLAREAPRLGSP